jgi:hypothetical protein
MFVLPDPASAAERRPDGIRTKEAAPLTEFSARKRRYSRRHVTIRRVWRPRYGYVGPRYGYRSPGYAYWGPGYTWGGAYAYWGPRYAWGSRYYWNRPYRFSYWGAPHAAYPHYYGSWRSRPTFGFSIGFGPSWWW